MIQRKRNPGTLLRVSTLIDTSVLFPQRLLRVVNTCYPPEDPQPVMALRQASGKSATLDVCDEVWYYLWTNPILYVG